MNENSKTLRTNFYAFYRYMFGVDKATNWWEEEFCEFLRALYYSYLKEERPIYCVEAPVQHGKSTKMRYFLAWLIGRHPDKRFNFYSADDKLKEETSHSIDMIMQDPRYVSIFGCLDIKKNTKEIMLRDGGIVQFRIMGGGNTGYPSHFSIIDDPYAKREDAHSTTFREKVWLRLTADIISRRQNDSMVLITHSRWHVDDMIGNIKNTKDSFKSPVKIFNYPAIAINNEKHRKRGQPLFPDLRSSKFLEEQRSIMTENDFMSLYQQNPILAGGNLFKLDWFLEKKREHIPEEKDYDYRFIVGDTSYKEKQSADYTVFGYFGVKDKKLYLIDMIRKKINAIDVIAWCEDWIRSRADTYGFRYAWIEPLGHGIYLNQYFKKVGVSIPPDDKLKNVLNRRLDKVERANNIISRIDKIANNVILCSDIDCYEDFKEELLSFPQSGGNIHDDTVDVFIDAVKIALAERDIVSEYEQLVGK